MSENSNTFESTEYIMARELVTHPPIIFEVNGNVCTHKCLCGYACVSDHDTVAEAREYIEDHTENHAPDCPYRLAVEYLANQEGEGSQEDDDSQEDDNSITAEKLVEMGFKFKKYFGVHAIECKRGWVVISYTNNVWRFYVEDSRFTVETMTDVEKHIRRLGGIVQ